MPGLALKVPDPRPEKTEKDEVWEVRRARSMCPIPVMGKLRPRAIK